MGYMSRNRFLDFAVNQSDLFVLGKSEPLERHSIGRESHGRSHGGRHRNAS